jgi:hypothetical protein
MALLVIIGKQSEDAKWLFLVKDVKWLFLVKDVKWLFFFTLNGSFYYISHLTIAYDIFELFRKFDEKCEVSVINVTPLAT